MDRAMRTPYTETVDPTKKKAASVSSTDLLYFFGRDNV